jgi:hypothetical protein
MASGPVCRTQRPNTWLHRPMLHTFKKVLANSEPSTHGEKRTCRFAVQMSAYDPKRKSSIPFCCNAQHSTCLLMC